MLKSIDNWHLTQQTDYRYMYWDKTCGFLTFGTTSVAPSFSNASNAGNAVNNPTARVSAIEIKRSLLFLFLRSDFQQMRSVRQVASHFQKKKVHHDNETTSLTKATINI